jgi:D-alanyl-D-alanine carboxypeptidase (penicillin-binding protein 5/6)
MALASLAMLCAGGPALAGDAAPVPTIGGTGLAARGVRVATGLPGPPRITATAWLVADLDSGEVLAASNAHLRLAPASTLKILTAITLAPRLDPSRPYRAVDADVAIDGSKVGLVPGSRYTVSDLLYGLLLGSGNDAASALAALGGGAPATAALMNGESARLQACDTHAVNTSGLDARGQVSSAYDLALFGRAALADPQVARILATTRYRFPAAGTAFDQRRKRFEIQNHNRLLRNYPGATGVKNGFTELARGAFVGSAQRAGHRYVVTLLHAEGSTWHEAAALLDWAFAAGARRPTTAGIGRLVDPAGPQGPGGCGAERAIVLGAPDGVTPGAAPAAGAGLATDTGEAVAIPTRWLVTASAGLLALVGYTGVRLRRRAARPDPPAS